MWHGHQMYQSAIGRQYKQRLGKTRGDAAAIVTLRRSSLAVVVNAVRWVWPRATDTGDRVKSMPNQPKQWVQEFQSIAKTPTGRSFYDKFMNFR